MKSYHENVTKELNQAIHTLGLNGRHVSKQLFLTILNNMGMINEVKPTSKQLKLVDKAWDTLTNSHSSIQNVILNDVRQFILAVLGVDALKSNSSEADSLFKVHSKSHMLVLKIQFNKF